MGSLRQEANGSGLADTISAPYQKDVAATIGRLAADLRKMATGAELDFLAYLLGMAEQEADLVARNRPGR
jgi:hypothetical protein